MDCKRAGLLMMSYMDSVITEEEAASLNSHIINCELCKGDFMLYEYMAGEFEAHSVLSEAPADFELRVMKNVYIIEPDYCKAYTQDAVVGFVVGAFSILFGAGVIISMHQEEIMEMFSRYPVVGTVMGGAARASASAFEFAGGLAAHAQLYFDGALALIDSAKYVILIVVAALIAIQAYIYSRNKVEA